MLKEKEFSPDNYVEQVKSCQLKIIEAFQLLSKSLQLTENNSLSHQLKTFMLVQVE